jgi:hypothetical protein
LTRAGLASAALADVAPRTVRLIFAATIRTPILAVIAPVLADIAPVIASFLADIAPVLAPLHTGRLSLGI